jgi:hypothetical protein
MGTADPVGDFCQVHSWQNVSSRSRARPPVTGRPAGRPVTDPARNGRPTEGKPRANTGRAQGHPPPDEGRPGPRCTGPPALGGPAPGASGRLARATARPSPGTRRSPPRDHVREPGPPAHAADPPQHPALEGPPLQHPRTDQPLPVRVAPLRRRTVARRKPAGACIMIGEGAGRGGAGGGERAQAASCGAGPGGGATRTGDGRLRVRVVLGHPQALALRAGQWTRSESSARHWRGSLAP